MEFNVGDIVKVTRITGMNSSVLNKMGKIIGISGRNIGIEFFQSIQFGHSGCIWDEDYIDGRCWNFENYDLNRFLEKIKTNEKR